GNRLAVIIVVIPSPGCWASKYHSTRPERPVAIGCELLLKSGPVKTREWRTMSWSESLPGPGGWLTVKVGKVNVEGRAPVVKSRGAEPVPSLRTSRISYVVLGSMPATKKFVLFPGTTGCALVFLQDGESPATLNWTNTKPAEEGGALYRATRGLSVDVMTASDPVTREATASTATAE